MTTNEIILADARRMHDYFTATDLPPINCVITDPPYGVDFQSNFAATPAGLGKTRRIEGDSNTEDAIKLFHQVMTDGILPNLAAEADLYLFTSWGVVGKWTNLMASYADLTLKQCIVWEKGWPGLGDLNNNWGCGHEFILYYKKGKRPVNYRRSAVLHFDAPIDRAIAETEQHLERLRVIQDGGELSHHETSVISIDKPATMKHFHPTEKPVALIEQLIRMSTTEGDFVVDPFSGSGSTSLAAQNLGRDSLAFEIDEEYVRVSRERLAKVGLF